MATGGRDSDSTPMDSDSVPQDGGTAPGTYSFSRNEFFVNANQLHTRQVMANNLGVQGSLIVHMNPHAYQPRYHRPDMEDQALWPIPPPEDVSDRFTEDELDRVIEEKYLSYVANSCDEKANWRRLARKLKLDPPSLTRLEQDYPPDDFIHEFVYQLLLKWKQRHPDYRVRELIKVLSDSKLQKPALELKKYFTSIH